MLVLAIGEQYARNDPVLHAWNNNPEIPETAPERTVFNIFVIRKLP